MLYLVVAASAALAGLGVYALVADAWGRSRSGPRCGRASAFLLRLIVPAWVFVGTTSTLTTLWVVAFVALARAAPNVFDELSSCGALLVGFGASVLAAWHAAVAASARLRVWLTYGPADDD